MDDNNFPILKPKEIIFALKKIGFSVVKTHKRHKLLMHQDCRRTTIPVHKNRSISPVILKLILKDISVDINEFLKLL